MKVLIVDDEPDARRLLSFILRLRQHETLEAADGWTALLQAASASPDVILLDVMMPGLDGYETCRRLKGDPATCRLPVVIVSAKSQPSEVAAGLKAGAEAYLLKPIDMDDLLNLIERCEAKVNRTGDP